MNTTNLPKPLKGIIPPMVTPLLDRDNIDIKGLEKLIEHILSGCVHGLFILGTTGEAPSLSYKLRYELIERVCKLVNKRVPVLVGITDTSHIESIKIAEYSHKQGVSAVVLAPPYYFPTGQPELLEYIEHLAPKIPVPLFLYNMPSCTKVFFEPETVIKAAQIPNIHGIKDSSANMIYFHKLQLLLNERKDFSFLVGPEELLAETILLGGHGGICGGANIFPRLYVDLYDAAIAGNMDKVRELHNKVMWISTTIYSTGKHSSSFLKGVKCSLNLMNICSDFIEEPFHCFREQEKQKIKKYLKELK
ncbi:MAG: dihydrodipicolinate synthase family protein [Planctomycetes bacterium GWF2_41_51]|nr:MAG: dihydrodipicolinate synthase family protein [Planctomycetes bacterium GWF2_41_51]HBG28022.1 dihydrodipicolinate synthase family protein [Phycisphaerales bacterium]